MISPKNFRYSMKKFQQSQALAMILFLAVLIPAVSGQGAEGELTGGQALDKARQDLARFDKTLSPEVRRSLKGGGDKTWLAPSVRRLYEERSRLRVEVDDWENVLRLKKDILDLQPTTDSPARPEEEIKRGKEAEDIARMAIAGFRELRKKYGMIRPAFLHNMFVNMGVKKEGFCWHWTRDLRKRLLALKLEEYDLLWATARGETVREHNTLVVTPRGQGLLGGLLLDGWRQSGKPFWIRVAVDLKKYPWKPGEYYESLPAGDQEE